MKLTFLGAEYPLVKSFSMEHGALVKSPYPNAFRFTSHTHDVSSLDEMFDLSSKYAAQGCCLLKGELSRELKAESRAGATATEDATSWVCLDIDGLKNNMTIDRLLEAIGLDDVSHIVQYSASAGIDIERGLSAHVFFMLSSPVSAPFLKQWLMHLNLSHAILQDEIALTRTGNALRWPIDITTCQNDKLLYIAPPTLGKGVKDTLKGKRMSLVRRKLEVFPTSRIKVDVQKVRAQSKELLNKLRKDAGYAPVKDNQYKTKTGIAYLASPGEAVITGIKAERDFVYFNLNGGDSWGYYHPTDNPEYIFNFKGEPTYRTEELLPEYWKSVKDSTVDREHGVEYFAIRDFESDTLFNGSYDKDTDTLTIAKASNETRLKSFVKQHGMAVPDFWPDWKITYSPKSNIKYDPDARIINLYSASPFYQLAPKLLAKMPVTIDKIITSAVGSGEVKAHFLNWIAFIVQYRELPKTAWVLMGEEGTGKGMLYNKVLKPMLGENNCSLIGMKTMEGEFTGWMENKLLVFCDEIQFSKMRDPEYTAARMRTWIVEPTVEIRKHYRGVFTAPNYAGYIIASNKPDPALLSQTDRRFNVGRFQPDKLALTDHEIDVLIPKELPGFFQHLMAMKVDVDAVRTVLETSDRELLKTISMTSIDEVANALLQGDLEYLVDLLPSSDDPIFQTPAANAYRSLIDSFVTNNGDTITREEMFIIFDYAIGNMPRSPNKFTSLLKHHRIHTKKVRRGNDLTMGMEVVWKVEKGWLEEQKLKRGKKTTQKVVPLSKRAVV
jgi:hypothetical protein